ncbi:MAG: hypothetical protein JNL67_00950 [Planctomycetaceae bacterium]|nr:hypothetical protein [Planctomycetaceae bacterium]
MSAWYRELKPIWPLAPLAFIVLLLGYAGYWPALPFVAKRTKGAHENATPAEPLFVEWLVKQDSAEEPTASPIDVTHFSVASLDSETTGRENSEAWDAVTRPQVTRVGDNLFCLWQSHTSLGGVTAIKIFGSWSLDGTNWTPPEVVFSVSGMSSRAKDGVLNSASFLSIDDQVYAVAAIYETIGYANNDSTNVSESLSAEPTAEYPRGVRELLGYVTRRLGPDRSMGNCIELIRWLDGASSDSATLISDPVDQGLISDIVERLATPDSRFGGKMDFPELELETEDRYRLSNPTQVTLPEDRILRLWGSDQGLDRLYGQISHDNGLTWDKPFPTNIRQNGLNAALGTLPNGPVFLAGNQLRTKRGFGTPLTVSIAFDDLKFAECFELLRDVPERQHAKNPTLPAELLRNVGFQVGSCLIDGEWLLISYSVNAEKIQLSRVRAQDLAPAVTEKPKVDDETR